MTLNRGQIKEMLEASKPLIKWMNDNLHPHCTVLVDNGKAELMEGIATCRTDEFIKD